MADVNNIPKGWFKPENKPPFNVEFKDIELMDYQKKMLADLGIVAHGVSMSIDPACPSGDHSVIGPVGPTGPQGPVGSTGVPGPKGAPYDPPVGPEAVMQELGKHFQIPAHPDEEVHQQMIFHEIAKQHPALAQSLEVNLKSGKTAAVSITKNDLVLAKVLIPKAGQINANGDAFTEECLKKAFPPAVVVNLTTEQEEEFKALLKEAEKKPKKIYSIPGPIKPEISVFEEFNPVDSIKMPSPDELKHFYNEQLGIPHELDVASDIDESQPMPDPLKAQQEVNQKIFDALPTKPFPDLPPLTSTPKKKNTFEELWDKSHTKTGRTSSKTPNMANTGKTKQDVEMVEVIMNDEGNSTTRKIEKETGGMAQLLAPRQYDADLVFEAVRQVVTKIQEAGNEKLLRKVSDTIAEVIAAERAQWKQAYNAVTSDYHQFRTETMQWSKEQAVCMAELSMKVEELVGTMQLIKAENAKLKTENSKLRIKGGLNRLPRKVKVDNDPSE